MDLLTISDFANDTADSAVQYRNHTITFTFRPGSYSGELAKKALRAADVVAACVTKWNIEVPIEAAEIEKLPAGAISAVYEKIVQLATQADLPEAPEKSPTG